MIPDEAVEAATEVIWEMADSLQSHEYAKEIARAALEAATPRFIEQAWEEAYGLGWADRNVGAQPTRSNPYRRG
jgi:hypothetical protein